MIYPIIFENYIKYFYIIDIENSIFEGGIYLVTTKDLGKGIGRISISIFQKLHRNKSIQETSLTDEVIDQLRILNSDRLLVINGKNEARTGADIEWWIVFPGNAFHEPQAMHLRIQAKRLHLRLQKDHYYKELDHKNGKQMEDLIRESNKIGAIPLYCFYN